VDTGAAVSIVREDAWKQSGLACTLEDPTEVVSTVSGADLTVTGAARIIISLGSRVYQHVVLVAPVLSHPVLLGNDFLKHNKIDILLSENLLRLEKGYNIPLITEVPLLQEMSQVVAAQTFVLPPQSETMIQAEVRGSLGHRDCVMLPANALRERRGVLAAGALVRPAYTGVPVRILNPQVVPVTIYKNTRLGELQTYNPLPTLVAGVQSHETGNAPGVIDLSQACVSEGEKGRLRNLFVEFSDVISSGPTDLGRTRTVTHRIDTGDAVPIKIPPRRLPYVHREAAEDIVKDMLASNIVEESNSPWCSPVTLAKKKDGSLRFCCDFRKLNSVTRKDSYPLPRTDVILDNMAGANICSQLAVVK
jgi:hypothetical protein